MTTNSPNPVDGDVQALTEFERGVFYAAYLICELHDEPGVAADVIREANLDFSNIKSLDISERKILLRLNKTDRLSLENK
ncbi:hypothetical protein QMZ93_07235 [Pantoea stewartii subsp. indologenes]|uniref:hypothetical protein n=1 Tax=Pantoea stewartii TaxID=66269 RepID=UPI0024E00524|nr:hypothetical protein [Pantoea stewartii]MDK2633135.1 hypothetical protein [Pantoea stewartii subsp. indologenes]